MNGQMVIAYQDGDRVRQVGGIEPEDVGLHREALAQRGLPVIRVYDGIAEARERFPPGTRVLAARKWWKSQAGTVATEAETEAARLRNCHAHGWTCDSMGAHVPVRFDGDEGVLGWWASGLDVISRA